MTDTIAQTSGNDLFLYFWLTVTLFWIVSKGKNLARYNKQRQQKVAMQQPPALVSNEVDPFEIAYLQGGENEVTRTIIIGLVEHGFLKVNSESDLFPQGTTIEQGKIIPQADDLTDIECTVYDWFSIPRKKEEIFQKELPLRVNSFCLLYEEKLQREQLFTNEKFFNVLITQIFGTGLGNFVVMMFVIAGSFFIPAIFFWVLLIGIIAATRILTPKRLSARGTAWIELLRRSRGSLKCSAGSKHALKLAILGVPALEGTPYSEFVDIFRKANESSTAGCGGCGGCGCG